MNEITRSAPFIYPQSIAPASIKDKSCVLIGWLRSWNEVRHLGKRFVSLAMFYISIRLRFLPLCKHWWIMVVLLHNSMEIDSSTHRIDLLFHYVDQNKLLGRLIKMKIKHCTTNTLNSSRSKSGNCICLCVIEWTLHSHCDKPQFNYYLPTFTWAYSTQI